jgi:hypothetical protein
MPSLIVLDLNHEGGRTIPSKYKIISLFVALILVALAVAFVVVDNEPSNRASHRVTKEDPQALALVTELRQTAWQRVTRSNIRQEARHDWKVEQARIARVKAAREARHDRIVALKADRREKRTINSASTVSLSGIAACIAKYESGGNPRAQNPSSSASGLYQFVDGTWNNYGGYSRAMYAPVSVQTEKFYQVWNNGAGAGQWVVSYKCGY